MKDLYSENRTEIYYVGGCPTEEQADAMTDLANAVHQFAEVRSAKAASVCVTTYAGQFDRTPWTGIHPRNERP